MRCVRSACLIVTTVFVTGIGCADRSPVAPDETSAPILLSTVGLSSTYNLAATATGPNWVALVWQDNSTREDGFEISRSTAGAVGPFTILQVTPADYTASGDGSVSPSAQYCYRIRAFKQVGRKTSYASYSNVACAKTPAPAPTDVRARPVSSTAVEVTWRDNAPTADPFRVERSTTGGTTWETAATVPANQFSYRDGNRETEQRVCYRIVAVGSDGDSQTSFAPCTSPPRAPSNLEAVVFGASILLTWADQSAVEERYEILRSEDGVMFESLGTVSANTTSFSDHTTTLNTAYWYQVRATKDGGISDVSNTVTILRACTATSVTEDVCDDGIDNDCDDLIDAYDPECGAPRCDFDMCPPGMVCGYDGFCYSHCGDGVQNGDESDVDCGGSCETKCQSGQQCWLASDCASGLCINSVCQPAGGGQ